VNIAERRVPLSGSRARSRCSASAWPSRSGGGVRTAADTAAAAIQQKAFETPEAAAEAMIAAAESFDVPALTEILGPDGVDLVVSEDQVSDRNIATAFAAEARTKTLVARDPEDKKVAVLSVGAEEWPLPIPIVKQKGKWRFDTAAGRDELLFRRIGGNEFDAARDLPRLRRGHKYASSSAGRW
jgi:hypothetical protein